MDFALLPPEVNSARMYAGAGSAPMTAAAAAWNQLAAVLNSSAGSYQAVVSQLTNGPWQGPAAASMAAAANPYVAWLHTTATQAAQVANQANAAAAAYQEAFAATVPPPLIAANRALLTSLVAANTFGQNTPAIAANQAQYAEMWAQDAAAMANYTAGSAAATTLTQFTAPPQTTDPAGIGAQAGAVGQTALSTASNAPGPLTQIAQNIVSNPTVEGLNRLLAAIATPTQNIVYGGLVTEELQYMLVIPAVRGAATAAVGYAGSLGLLPAVATSSVPEGAAGFTLAGSYGSGATGLADGGVSAGLGRATPVGGLSLPPSWATASPAIRLAAAALPTAGSAGLPEAGMAAPGSWLGGIPPVGSVVNAPTNAEPRLRSGAGSKATPQTAREAAATGTGRRRAQPRRSARATRDTPSERDELNRLRKAVAELTKERQVLERSADSLLKQAGLRPASPRRSG